MLWEAAKLCFCMENRGFGSFPSSKPWELMSHIMQSLQPISNPPFLVHPPRLLLSFHPSHSDPCGGSASPVTHPASGRSSPHGPGGTRGCQAPRADAGQTRRAADWPCKRAGVGAAAPRSPRGLPQRPGFRCPGHCCKRAEGVRGGDFHFYFRNLFYPQGFG